MTKTHTVVSKRTGITYELRKMRKQADSFFPPTYHARRAGEEDWFSLHCDTLAEARAELNGRARA